MNPTPSRRGAVQSGDSRQHRPADRAIGKGNGPTAGFAQGGAVLKRDRLSDQIARDIEARILSGELAIGDALPSERNLMAHYGVGRPAVREALLWLNKTGVLSVSNGDRTCVTEPDPRDWFKLLSGASRLLLSRPEGVRQFQQARTFVEVAMVREAARLATDADRRALTALLAANEQSGGDTRAFAATDDAFHHRIAQIARNPLVDAAYPLVLELLEDQRRMSLSHPLALLKAVNAHRAICDAICGRDPERAEAAMREHLETVEATYWQMRQERP